MPSNPFRLHIFIALALLVVINIFQPHFVGAQTPIPSASSAPAASGSTCTYTTECPTGYTCPSAAGADGTRRCTPAATNGTTCTTNSQCGNGGTCTSGRCVSPPGATTPTTEPSASAPGATAPTSGGLPAGTTEQLQGSVVVPELAVPIPGLAPFEAPAPAGSSSQAYLDLPFLGQYINAVYNYALGVAVTLATVMIVIGGLKWMLARGDSSKVSDAKETLSRAIIGMFLVLGSYTVLKFINPELVNLRALRIQVVQRQETQEDLILSVQGSMADDEAYSSPSSPAFAGAPEATPTGGSFRGRMYEACGNRQGMSLATYEEKMSRLRNIVSAWADIGARQGGAIYVNGGNSSCTGNHARPAFMQSLLPRLSGFRAPCPTASSCAAEWRTEYNRLVTERARAAGMFCGDCATTIRSLYDCFQSGGSLGQIVMRLRPESCTRDVSSPNYVFKIQASADGRIPQAELLQAAQRLRFGDVLGWKKPGGAGHVFMYTGGANLGYEIMEMGNGGTGDVEAAGGTRAWERIGSNFSGSGLRTHNSAQSYLTHVSTNRRGGTGVGCVWAWRPILQ